MNHCLTIFQYNVHKLKNQIMISCLQNFKCLNYNVLIVQKLWINSYSFIIYHLIKKNFHLIYFNFHKINDVTIKMCFFVNNRIFFIDIETRYVFDDLIILQICINSDVNNSHADNHYFQIHNIYNEPIIDSCTMLSELQTVLKKKKDFDINNSFSSFQNLKIGDFNIHHIKWKNVNAINDLRIPKLFILINEFGLVFNIFKHIKIYVSWIGNEFMINLNFVMKKFLQWIIFYMTRENLNHDSNHLFIKIILNIFINTAPSAKKFCWNKTDTIKLNDIFNQKFLNISAVKSIFSLNLFIIQINETIYAVIINSTLKFLIKTRATSKFNN